MDEPQSTIQTDYEFEASYSQPKQQERSSSIRLDEDPELIDKDLKDGKDVKFTNDIIVIGAGEGEGDASDFKPVDPTDPILPISQFSPEYPGGLAAMSSFINKNIDIPDYAQHLTSGGTVYVDFVVNKDGSIEQVEIKQGISPEIDAAAMKVVSKMPRWSPGMNAGKPVRVRFTLPIKIKFQ